MEDFYVFEEKGGELEKSFFSIFFGGVGGGGVLNKLVLAESGEKNRAETRSFCS